MISIPLRMGVMISQRPEAQVYLFQFPQVNMKPAVRRRLLLGGVRVPFAEK